MRVFVTGASGEIGSALVPELISAGHDVIGLVRSDRSAQAVEAMGASVLLGDLNDPDSLRRGAAACDGIIHLAFDHGDFARSVAMETHALETFGAALNDSGKALLVASGTPVVVGRASTEEDPPDFEGPLAGGPLAGRARNAQAILDMAEKGVRSVVVRLPRSVHSRGRRCGFASFLIEAARRTGVSGYVGDGTQLWPAVHRLDAAHLFRILLEKAPSGTVAHAVADEGDPMRVIAEVIGRQLNLPTKSVPAEHFGFLGSIFGADQPASSRITRARFAWNPSHPSLLEDLEAGNYPA